MGPLLVFKVEEKLEVLKSQTAGSGFGCGPEPALR
jgi:hypothetical protein